MGEKSYVDLGANLKKYNDDLRIIQESGSDVRHELLFYVKSADRNDAELLAMIDNGLMHKWMTDFFLEVCKHVETWRTAGINDVELSKLFDTNNLAPSRIDRRVFYNTPGPQSGSGSSSGSGKTAQISNFMQEVGQAVSRNIFYLFGFGTIDSVVQSQNSLLRVIMYLWDVQRGKWFLVVPAIFFVPKLSTQTFFRNAPASTNDFSVLDKFNAKKRERKAPNLMPDSYKYILAEYGEKTCGLILLQGQNNKWYGVPQMDPMLELAFRVEFSNEDKITPIMSKNTVVVQPTAADIAANLKDDFYKEDWILYRTNRDHEKTYFGMLNQLHRGEPLHTRFTCVAITNSPINYLSKRTLIQTFLDKQKLNFFEYNIRMPANSSPENSKNLDDTDIQEDES